MKRYIKDSSNTSYLGIDYIVSRSKNDKGYVFVIPSAKGIKGIKASSFAFSQTEADSQAHENIEAVIKYLVNQFKNSISSDSTPCPQCGVADYYNPESGTCANCGYYADFE